MPTIFEYWNGCIPFIDEEGQPYFGFDYDPSDEALLSFFQISARISEIVTEVDWLLYMNEALFDVPDVQEDEMLEAVSTIGAEAGYEFKIFEIEANHPTEGPLTVPVGLWVNLRTGLMEAYHPVHGLQTVDQVYETPMEDNDFVSQDVFNIYINEAPPPEAKSGGSSFLKNAKTVVGILVAIKSLAA